MPYLVHVWCLAHRLNLACNDAANDIAFVTTFKSRFNTLYWHFSASATHTFKLEQIQEVLEDPCVRVKQPINVRWPSLNAVAAVAKCYVSVLMALSQLGAEGNTTASILFTFFLDYKVLLSTGFMLDVHEILGILSQQLQKECLLFSEVKHIIEGCVTGLRSLSDTDGQHLTALKKECTFDDSGKCSIKGVDVVNAADHGKANFNSMGVKYIDSVIKHIYNAETWWHFAQLRYPRVG